MWRFFALLNNVSSNLIVKFDKYIFLKIYNIYSAK